MEKVHKRLEIVDLDTTQLFEIEDIEYSEERISITGWALKTYINSQNSKYTVVLYEPESNSRIFVDTKMENREDVHSYFSDGQDYLNTGFIASVLKKKLHLDTSYEVLLYHNVTNRLYKTGVLITSDEAFRTPTLIEPLKTEDTILDDIVTNGVLCVARPDYSMYVYQHGNALYWIADENFNFVNGRTYIQYQLGTTQIENLPSERQKYKGDNIGFYFEDYELTGNSTGNYRVAKRDIPKEYAITTILTGYYTKEDGWIWQNCFKPNYKPLIE